ncbi:MAG: PGPGW domain-containing protein [Actinobacteria bacterium]|nr:PGPGW domain-containing protein [Actinomycetota bacterium]
MVAAANKFLVHFVERAPEPGRPLARVEDPHTYRSTELSVERERKTVRKHTRRAIVTIIGLCLIVVAFLIGWIPGPWSIPLVIAGLAVLATEYDWADDFLTWARGRYEKTKAKFKARRSTAE